MFTKNPLINCRIGRIDHRLGADDLSDDTAAIDVTHQNHRHIGGAGKAHVGDVVRAQIDFRRATGAFHKDQVSIPT